MAINVCRICGNSKGNNSFTAREMMFGYRDEFTYFECANCSCVQIKEYPNDLSKYYPPYYYSFYKRDVIDIPFHKLVLKRKRMQHWLGQKNFIGMILYKIYGEPVLPQSVKEWLKEWVKYAKLKTNYKIMDLGCGSGDLLCYMRQQGFSNLIGVDPYIEDDILYKNGVKILKKDLKEINMKFDFIMLHQSFEHMDHPKKVLKKLYDLLKPNRYLLIRIPISSSFAWRHYRTNWVQLDPPRHLYLHSTHSIKIMADEVGFSIENVIYDSTEFQFWGSEQYIMDMSLFDERSYGVNPSKSIFSNDEIISFREKAKCLNDIKEG